MDTGSKFNLISDECATAINGKLKESSISLFAANNSKVESKGMIVTEIKVHDLLFKNVRLLVANIGESVILGVEFIINSKATINLHQGIVKIGNVTLPLIKESNKTILAINEKGCMIEPQKCRILDIVGTDNNAKIIPKIMMKNKTNDRIFVVAGHACGISDKSK